MDSTTFKKLLFEAACCTIACDFDIDETEIKELHSIDESTVYFEDIDLSKQLEDFLADIKENETERINELVEKRVDELIERIKDATLSPVEELLIMEIILRLMYADTVIHENEVKLLNSVRLVLSLSDEIITERFGMIDFLLKRHDASKVAEGKTIEIQEDVLLDLDSIENVYLETDDDKKQK